MKLEFSPEAQRKKNEQIVRRLRFLGVMAFLLLVASIATGAMFYMRGPVIPATPQVLSPDGNVVLGDAIFIAPDLVLTAGAAGDQAEVVYGADHWQARKINAAGITDQTQLVLLRLDSQSSVTPASPVAPDNGTRVAAISSGVLWHGVVESQDANIVVVSPDFTLQPGVGVYLESDRTALVGISAQQANKIVIVSAMAVVNKFPELGAAK